MHAACSRFGYPFCTTAEHRQLWQADSSLVACVGCKQPACPLGAGGELAEEARRGFCCEELFWPGRPGGS